MLQAHRVQTLYSDESSERSTSTRAAGALLPRSGYDFGDGQGQRAPLRRAGSDTAGRPREREPERPVAHTNYQTAVAPMGKAKTVRSEEAQVRMPGSNVLRKVGQSVTAAPAPFKGQIKSNMSGLKGALEVRNVGGRLVPMARSGADVVRDPLSPEDRQGSAVRDALNRSECLPVYGGWAPDDSLRFRNARVSTPGIAIPRAALTRRQQVYGLGDAALDPVSSCVSRADAEAYLRGTGVSWSDDAGFRRQLSFWLGDFPEGTVIRYEGLSICFDGPGAVAAAREIQPTVPSSGGGEAKGGSAVPSPGVVSPDAVRTATTEIAREVASTAVWYGVGALAIVGGLWWWFSRDEGLSGISLPQDQTDGNRRRTIRIERVRHGYEVHATPIGEEDWHPIARGFDTEDEAREWANEQTGTHF